MSSTILYKISNFNDSSNDSNLTFSDNITTLIDEQLEFEEFKRAVSISVSFTFSVIFLIGLLGNLLVVTVVTANPLMRNTTNILIFNLAISDLLFVIFCVPATATDYVLNWWPFGDIICGFVQYMIVVTCHGSVYTLVMMSFDRFLAVVHPIASMSIRTERNALLAIKIAWFLIIVTAFPWLFAHGETYHYLTEEFNDTIAPDSIHCDFLEQEGFSKPIFQITFFMTSYFIPLTLISALYIGMLLKLWRGHHAPGVKPYESELRRRGKKRVTQMIVAVVLAFAICWLPIHIVLIVKSIYPDIQSTLLIKVQIISHILAYCSSCVNPLLYAFLSDNFRKAFRKVVNCREKSSAVIAKETQTNTKLTRPTIDQSIDVV